MRSLFDGLLALPAGLLPRRHWGQIDLPIEQRAVLSGLLTLLGGAAFGITGFFSYLQGVMESAFFVPSPLMMAAYFGYLFFTPRGLFSLYLVASGLVRTVSAWIGEPFGDPILTGIDTALHRTRRASVARWSHHERTEAEGADEPDRRYPGAWADLPGVDFVVVAARRKPGWTEGTFVITPDGWFTLGEPFDRPTPNGLRTVYPLTALATMTVLRKGVSYELPPLRPHAARRVTATGEPPPRRGES